MAYLATRPDFSGLASVCLMGTLVRTIIGCAWKYLQSLLATCTSANMSFSNASKTTLMFSSKPRASSISAIHCIVFLSAQLLKALKKGSDFLAPFDRNRLSAARFPLRICISLSVLGGSRVKLHVDRPEPVEGLLNIFQHILFGDTLDRHVINVGFKILSNLIAEYLIYQSLVSSSGVLQTKRHLAASRKHFSQNPERDSTFQSISSRG
ncbi:hypothetical protein Tco_0812889 [Tanacetum coccineum]